MFKIKKISKTALVAAIVVSVIQQPTSVAASSCIPDTVQETGRAIGQRVQNLAADAVHRIYDTMPEDVIDEYEDVRRAARDAVSQLEQGFRSIIDIMFPRQSLGQRIRSVIHRISRTLRDVGRRLHL